MKKSKSFSNMSLRGCPNYCCLCLYFLVYIVFFLDQSSIPKGESWDNCFTFAKRYTPLYATLISKNPNFLKIRRVMVGVVLIL